ncbi:MAG: Rieske (2Fe-2S) protein [Arthrobacter sp.]|uniref:Rieske (2Fe-2S) protein n=1 Tax=unclassified Arthrobacter TaxID=235627 RepID=UPI00264EAC49|nr:Rieske (2Fe-2S) protein [Micrococcaceae bacterium]MDN5813755.1 Rieske (2Fe-2S) protein [Micrococcaceae bacterium]MDN5824158.1 Rieske (2Fe-2S) protein [Micrococcaceae bacterium]MDN5880332.1 Rieske (2Fe-2S) protein [Micrococcaceae bacterium]MDN5887701.1 Rieske (2Fe-2S) protein [Micrococcaceae bacterium]
MNTSAQPCRRLVLGSTLALGAGTTLAACGDGSSAAPQNTSQPVPEPAGNPLTVAPVADLPVGSMVNVDAEATGETYLLYRKDEETVLAYTAVCTHAGCRVGPGEEDFICPCHESHFDPADGTATGGPAREALTRFAAEIADGQILLYP